MSRIGNYFHTLKNRPNAYKVRVALVLTTLITAGMVYLLFIDLSGQSFLGNGKIFQLSHYASKLNLNAPLAAAPASAPVAAPVNATPFATTPALSNTILSSSSTTSASSAFFAQPNPAQQAYNQHVLDSINQATSPQQIEQLIQQFKK